MARDSDELLSTEEASLVRHLAGLVPLRDPAGEGRLMFSAGQQEAQMRFNSQRQRARWLTAAALVLVATLFATGGWQFGKAGKQADFIASGAPVRVAGEAPSSVVPETTGMSFADVQRTGSAQSLETWIDQLLERHGFAPGSWSGPQFPGNESGVPLVDARLYTQAELRRELLRGDFQ